MRYYNFTRGPPTQDTSCFTVLPFLAFSDLS
jgi:hypothetical protein